MEIFVQRHSLCEPADPYCCCTNTPLQSVYSQNTTPFKVGVVLPDAFTTSFGSTINCISIQLHGDGVIVGVVVGVGVGSVHGQIPDEH